MLYLPSDVSPYQVWFRPAQDLRPSVSPLNIGLKSRQWIMPSGTKIFITPSTGMRGWRGHKHFLWLFCAVLSSRWIKFINPLVDFLPCLRYLALLILNLPFKSKLECFSCARKQRGDFWKGTKPSLKEWLSVLGFRCELVFVEILSGETVCLVDVNMDLENTPTGWTEAVNYWWALETSWWICTPLLSPLWLKCKWNLMWNYDWQAINCSLKPANMLVGVLAFHFSGFHDWLFQKQDPQMSLACTPASQ